MHDIQSWKLERMEAEDNISLSEKPEGEKVWGGGASSNGWG